MQSRSHLPHENQGLPQAGQEEQKVFLNSDRVSGTFSKSRCPGNSLTQISITGSYPYNIRFGLVYVLTIYVDT